jgi:hypothetical protein
MQGRKLDEPGGYWTWLVKVTKKGVSSSVVETGLHDGEKK